MGSNAPQPRSVATLEALKHHVDDIATLPVGSFHRLHASRNALSLLIAKLGPTHVPLLSLIKQEYEAALEPLAARAVKHTHSLHPIHPLQLTAAYHEADLRHLASRVQRVDREVIRVARLKARLRAGVLESTRR